MNEQGTIRKIVEPVDQTFETISDQTMVLDGKKWHITVVLKTTVERIIKAESF